MTATTARSPLRTPTRRGALLPMSGLVVVALLLVGTHLADVHHRYGVWA